MFVTLVFLSYFALFESPSGSSVMSLHPEILRILRVTSPLLIVFVSKEGNIGYWFIFLSFENCDLPTQWVREMKVSTLKYSGFWEFLLIPPHWNWANLSSTSFIDKILPNTNLSYFRLELNLCRWLSLPRMMNRMNQIFRFWKIPVPHNQLRCILFIISI